MLQLSKKPDFHIVMAVAGKLNRHAYEMVYGNPKNKQNKLEGYLLQF